MKKALMIAAVLATSWLNTQNTKCMDLTLESHPIPYIQDPIIKPLEQWQIVNHTLDYSWCSLLSLERNQKFVVDTILAQCFDFSFKADEEQKMSGLTNFGKVQIVSSKTVNDFPVYIRKFMFVERCTEVYDCTQQAQETIKKYLTEIAQNPEGCELLRTIIATHSQLNNTSKIICIPNNANIFSYAPGKNRSLDWSLNETLDCLFIPINYIPIKTYMINKDDIGGLQLCIKPMQADAIIHHELVHYYHRISELVHYNHKILDMFLQDKIFNFNSASQHAILSRTSQQATTDRFKLISSNFSNEQHLYLPYWIETFCDDEEFDTMYGILYNDNELAINPLNESTYMSSKYGFIRATHQNLLFLPECNYQPDSEAQQSFIQYIDNCSDKELYRYYLYPNQSKPHPVFGMGQYECIDLNPENGEALIAAQAQDENIEQ